MDGKMNRGNEATFLNFSCVECEASKILVEYIDLLKRRLKEPSF